MGIRERGRQLSGKRSWGMHTLTVPAGEGVSPSCAGTVEKAALVEKWEVALGLAVDLADVENFANLKQGVIDDRRAGRVEVEEVVHRDA